jgi:hypothetical protein
MSPRGNVIIGLLYSKCEMDYVTNIYTSSPNILEFFQWLLWLGTRKAHNALKGGVKHNCFDSPIEPDVITLV